MDTYLVSYDLRQPGRDYSRLLDHLRTYTSWAKPLESVWIIKSSLSAEQLRDNITIYMDSNDKLFVGRIAAPAAWKNLSNEVSTWLRSYLLP